MLKMLKISAVALLLAMGLGVMPAHSTPINGGFSVSGGVAPLGSAAINTATGLDFAPIGGSNSCTGSIAIAVGGIAATCNGATSVTIDIAAGILLGAGPIAYSQLGWITLSLGGVSFDLSGITLIGRSAIGIPSLDLFGTGVLHATGFDATAGTFHLTAQGTSGTFSFSSTQIASAVPEPATLALLGLGLVGLGFVRRRSA